MSQKFLHLFPLSVYRDTLGTTQQQRDEWAAEILQMQMQMQECSDEELTESGGASVPNDSAWLGDEQGHEFLFRYKQFESLFALITARIGDYVEQLGINTELIEFFYQRAWATVTRHGERINQHSHEQSNISFAYYLKKPQGAGGINFITEDHPNEFSRGIFTPAKQDLGFIARPSALTWNLVSLNPHEDEIVIFPSKTLHSTTPSESDEPRISISADVTTLLRDSRGHETMMPHFSNWKSFDDYQT